MEIVMKNPKNSEWLQRVYNTRDKQELEACYDAWAQDYDEDVLSYGYRGPTIVSALIARYVTPKNGSLLDAGSGTGIVGEILTPLGYNNLFGIDLSQSMLELAHCKGLYRDLQRMILGEPLDFPDDRFSATYAAGVFTTGHAPPESLDELVRITKPGGYIIFTIRAEVYQNEGFKEQQNALEKTGKWRLVELTDPFQSLPVIEPEAILQVFVYQVS